MALRDGEVKRTVLCFVFDRKSNKLLMIQKKRGQGAGKWNVPGGKVMSDETWQSAAIRECQEETGICPTQLTEMGKLDFFFPESNSWDNTCVVFATNVFSGVLEPETEECSAHWLDIAKIPYESMWDADRAWIPELLAGRPFHRSYTFDRDDHVKEEKIIL